MTIKLPLTPASWSIRYSPGMPAHPTASGTGWKFSFPSNATGVCPAADTTFPNYNVSPCHHVDYVTTAYTKSIATANSVSMTYQVDGTSPVFDYRTQFENDQTNTLKHSVRLLLEHTGDFFLDQDTYRWWSNPLYVDLNTALNAGPQTLSVPLSGHNWSDVNGIFCDDPSASAGFLACKQHMQYIGMTFGGGYFFGHGLFLDSGSATFTVTDFEID